MAAMGLRWWRHEVALNPRGPYVKTCQETRRKDPFAAASRRPTAIAGQSNIVKRWEILEGEQPHGLSLKDFIGVVPLSWSEQRRAYKSK
jgi:hypothetical protein